MNTEYIERMRRLADKRRKDSEKYSNIARREAECGHHDNAQIAYDVSDRLMAESRKLDRHIISPHS